MFDDEVTLRKNTVSSNQFKNKSMFSKLPECILEDEKLPKSDMICMQTLTSTSCLDEKYQKPRSKTVGSSIEVCNVSSEPRTSKNTKSGAKDVSDETLLFANIIPSDCYIARLNTQLLEAVQLGDAEKAERLIITGANPNATCRLRHDSACHIAALVGGDCLSILLKYGADTNRSTKLGGTPIHMAAWAGNVEQIAALLGLPEKIQREIKTGLTWRIIEEKIGRLNGLIRSIANIKSQIGTVTVLAKTWKDSYDHKCENLKLPSIETAWTPLHVASSCARYHSVRLLLAAGADPNKQDDKGQTPLDVAGTAFYQGQAIAVEEEVIKILLNAGSKFHTDQDDAKSYTSSPLHIAMELEYLDVAQMIISAGASIKHLNHMGETPLHVCIRKQSTGVEIFSRYYTDDDGVAFDVRDKNGCTFLHAAVIAKWLPGIYIALENGADITLRAKNGDTCIHAAAKLGDICILQEILNNIRATEGLHYIDNEGQTALFKAIIHGHINCVELLLEKGASVDRKLPGNYNVLHVAARFGHSDILRLLLKHNDVITTCMIDEQSIKHEGPGPIHLAVIYNHVDCVEVLLNNNANCCLKVHKDYTPFYPSTPLHMAAANKHLKIAMVLLNHDRNTLIELDSNNWTPLHAASYYGHKEIIELFIHEGADITLRTKGPNKFKKTCIDLIMNNVTKPTEFMEDVFDSYIRCDDMKQVVNFINIDYRILTSNAGAGEQMKTVEALLETGDRFGQMRLLVHPLVESFLYLNWVYLLPFFYIMLAIYTVYVLSLNIFIVSTYFYKDTNKVPPIWLSPSIWRIFIFISGTLIFLQEILYMNFGSKTYFYRLESWMKLAAIAVAMILPTVLAFWSDDVWPRHLTTVALLLSWTEMMFMLSRFPNWGYYVLMFGKVLSTVLKILLTFVFLLIGFALSFMIQFHSKVPFDDPWAAFVKTIVMMTSEYDYLNLFDEEQTKGIGTSFIIIRILFLTFLLLAGIVLMNLMVGVAVHDLHNLEMHGNIRRLEKQVEFLSSLESVVYNEFLMNRLPNCLRMKRKIISYININVVDYKMLPLYLKDAIFHKAQERMKRNADTRNAEVLQNKIDEMHTLLEENRKGVSNKNRNGNETLDGTQRYGSIANIVQNDNLAYKDIVGELKERIELMSIEMDAVNAILLKLDNHVAP